MSALYIMRYGGIDGSGGGTLYIGNGKILGADVGLCRYAGTYEENGGVINGKATVTALKPDTPLVTGITLQANMSLPIEATLPVDFDTGELHTVFVAGQMVQVSFEKLGDIP